MKKTSKVFGAVALSAALAMGCVPAFAAAPNAPSAGNAETVEDATTDGNANTSIAVDTYVSQISVALPVRLPVYANVAGGAGVSPENYYIENLSRTDINVKAISWEVPTAAQQDWNLAKSAEISDGAAATQNTDGSTPGLGSLGFVLTPRATGATITVGSNTYTQGGTGAAQNIQGNSTSLFAGNNKNLDWTIKGSTGTSISTGKGEKLLLQVDTYSSALKKTLDSAYEDAVKVSYTVSAQSAS